MALRKRVPELVAESNNPLVQVHPSWERVRLGDIADILNGYAFSSSRFSQVDGFPLLRIRDVKNNFTNTYYSGEFDERYIVEKGDLVIGMDGDFNVTLWGGRPALLNQRVCKVSVEESIYLKRFLFYALPGYLNLIHRHTSSLTVKHLSSLSVADIPLPFPSLKEQRRIVDEIEKQFTRLDAAAAALERVQANLARYKAAVLKAACEGRLVEQDPADESAEILLQRISAERRRRWQADHPGKPYVEPKGVDSAELPDLPPGWVWTTVEELNPGDRSCAYGVLQPGLHVPSGTPLVRVGDINNGIISNSELKHIDPAIAERYQRTELKGGEVVISLVGAIGRTAVVPDTLRGANTARAVGVVPLVSQLSPYWVEIWFRNPVKVQEMTEKAHEVARKTLNLEDIRKASVAIPPLFEQQRIVAEVERRLSVVAAVESVIATNLARAARLRQSILQRAFTGRLVQGSTRTAIA